MLEQPSADAPLTPDAAPAKALGVIPILKKAGSFTWDLAKRAWRIEPVKSVAATWALRAIGATGGAFVVALVDSYMGGS